MLFCEFCSGVLCVLRFVFFLFFFFFSSRRRHTRCALVTGVQTCALPIFGRGGDGAIRGAGLELRLYGVDPDTAAARAEALGFTVLQAPADKPQDRKSVV